MAGSQAVARERGTKAASGRWKWPALAGAAAVGIAACSAVARRRTRVRTGGSTDARRPSWTKLLAEFPAAGRLMASQLKPAPVTASNVGRGRAVLVLPGFLAHDLTTLRLRRTLRAAGFKPFGWSQGINLGARADLLDRLEERLDEVIGAAGAPVALIGWSLGGLYARELAKRRPADVSLVVTLGTPFSIDLRHNNAWKLYEAINDHPVDDAPIPMDASEKPPVHTVAIWSARDGIVAPASSSGTPVESDEQLRVDSKHNELVTHPRVLRTIVDVLARGGATASRR